MIPDIPWKLFFEWSLPSGSLGPRPCPCLFPWLFLFISPSSFFLPFPLRLSSSSSSFWIHSLTDSLSAGRHLGPFPPPISLLPLCLLHLSQSHLRHTSTYPQSCHDLVISSPLPSPLGSPPSPSPTFIKVFAVPCSSFQFFSIFFFVCPSFCLLCLISLTIGVFSACIWIVFWSPVSLPSVSSLSLHTYDAIPKGLCLLLSPALIFPLSTCIITRIQAASFPR